MTAKTTRSNPRQFNWYKLKNKARRLLRKKHGKHISAVEFDRLWEDYLEYAFFKPLIEYGSVEVGKIKMEITGRKIINTPQYGIMSMGLRASFKGFVPIETVPHRRDYTYKISLNHKDYKGQLIFWAAPTLSKRVHEHLCNSHKYYRIIK